MFFPKLGTRCAHVIAHRPQFRLFPRLVPQPPRGRPCLPPFGVWPLFAGFMLIASTSTVLPDFLTPFMVTNSLCANSEDQHICTAFYRSSFSSRSSRSFSAGSSVDNTILSLIMLSDSVNSQDKVSVRSRVRKKSFSNRRSLTIQCHRSSTHLTIA